jgi:hypothetical protein
MIKGTYIFYEDGKEIYRSSNVITKFGKRFLTNVIAGNIPNDLKDIAIGIDSTAATVNDTRLGFEFYRLPVTLNSTDIQTTTGTTYSVIYKTTVPQDIAGTISEIGLYPQTRSSIVNFDSKFLSDFNNYLNWFNSSGYNPIIDTTNQKIGNNILKMNSNGTSSDEFYTSVNLDLSGYSLNDTIRLAYYKYDNHLSNIKVKFYHTNSDYYTATITPSSGTGYFISDSITIGSILQNSVGQADASQISKIAIVITPTSGQSSSIGLDGLRINDEDTFDPIFGLISRSVLNSSVIKLAGRQIDIEYKLDLSF